MWFLAALVFIVPLTVCYLFYRDNYGFFVTPRTPQPPLTLKGVAPEWYARQNWWCPEARARNANNNVTGFNRSYFDVKPTLKKIATKWLFPRYYWYKSGRHGNCLASGCGMWRWYDQTHGYCGLAGEPRVFTLDTSQPPR